MGPNMDEVIVKRIVYMIDESVNRAMSTYLNYQKIKGDENSPTVSQREAMDELVRMNEFLISLMVEIKKELDSKQVES